MNPALLSILKFAGWSFLIPFGVIIGVSAAFAVVRFLHTHSLVVVFGAGCVAAAMGVSCFRAGWCFSKDHSIGEQLNAKHQEN